MECPFLSTYERKIECFSECVLYNYKENNGVCPFKCLENNNDIEIEDFDFYNLMDRDFRFIKDSYSEMYNKSI